MGIYLATVFLTQKHALFQTQATGTITTFLFLEVQELEVQEVVGPLCTSIP